MPVENRYSLLSAFLASRKQRGLAYTLAALAGLVVGLLVGPLPVASAAETSLYSYDSVQRLTRVTHADGTTVDYVYDALGNRLMKTTTLPGSPANQPPAVVTQPNPANGADNVTNTTPLSWSAAVDPNSGDSVAYYVYLGTSNQAPLVSSGWATSWIPEKLRGNTTYYWQVVARDNHNAEAPSQVWSFTTGNEPPTADFVVSATNGWAPLTVAFTDRSRDIDNALVGWQWDFDNNGTVDSTNQNPVFIYPASGDYTVRLTVRDASGATDTMVRTNLINVLANGILDLAPISLQVLSAGSYRHLTVVYSVTNQGTITLAGQWSWSDAIYLAENPYFNSSDPQVGIFYEHRNLPAGAVYTRTNVVALPETEYPPPFLVLRADAVEEIGEIREDNNTSWPYQIRATLPDLVVEELILGSTPVSGEDLQIIGQVRNQGKLAIDAEWSDGVYLSAHDISTNRIIGGNDSLLHNFLVRLRLDPGAIYRWTNVVMLPQGVVGERWLVLWTDQGNGIVETNDHNNLRAVHTTIMAPDLAPVEFTAPAMAGSQQTIPVRWAVTNWGNGPALPPWVDAFYLSSDESLVEGADIRLTSFTWEQKIEGGSGYIQARNVILPGIIDGSYYLIVKLDDGNALSESGEANNTLATPISITTPDLMPTRIAIPATGGSGQTIEVSVVVTNQGRGTAGGTLSWNDELVLSSNPDGTGQIESLHLWQRTNAVVAGNAYTNLATIHLPQWAGGTYYLVARVDAYNDIFESVETNNVLAAVPIVLTTPDLMPIRLTAPTVVESGQTIEVSLVVTNQGNGAAGSKWSWSDELVLSTQPDGTGQIESLQGWGQHEPLAAGGVYTNATTLTLPRWAGGTYYLVARVDAYNDILESVETNNVLAAVPIVLTTPDLMPIRLMAPTVVESGQTIEVSVVVTNQGNGIAGGTLSWADELILSSKPDGTGQTESLHMWSQSDPVPAGSAYTNSATVTLPQWAGGIYYLTVRVDVSNGIFESVETNNVLTAVPIALTTPDLIPIRLTAPSVAESGQTIELSVVVTNQGNGIAGGMLSWADELILSSKPDGTGQTESLHIWSQSDPVPAGSAYTNSATVTLPQWAGGIYYLTVRVDVSNGIFESVETNNLISNPIRLVGDELLLQAQLSIRGEPVLTLYGPTNLSYVLEFTTNLTSPIEWLPQAYSVIERTNTSQILEPIHATNRPIFFRALRKP